MRSTRYTLDGRTLSLRHWAREYNMSVTTVRERIRQGIDLRTALTTPRLGYGYRSIGRYGIPDVFRKWSSAPLITENNLTQSIALTVQQT